MYRELQSAGRRGRRPRLHVSAWRELGERKRRTDAGEGWARGEERGCGRRADGAPDGARRGRRRAERCGRGAERTGRSGRGVWTRDARAQGTLSEKKNKKR